MILGSVVTSSVLYLMNTGSDPIDSLQSLKSQRVGIPFGNERGNSYLKRLHATPVVFDEPKRILHALKDGEIDFATLGSSTLQILLKNHPQFEKHLFISRYHLGYGTWVILGNDQYGRAVLNEPLMKHLDRSIRHQRNTLLTEEFCSRYLLNTAPCVF